ncbi:acyltransferase family protein [Prolixibacteraceae bacterium]|nr:acyltransferase family protein [Prolixibacteraceae bacterium]
MTKTKNDRIDYLDTLRVIACFLVVLCHVGDYYAENSLGGFGLSWSKLITLTRPCVPLFILLSGTLLLPLKIDTRSFFKRRFSRIVIPFFVWSILYVFFPIPSETVFGGPPNAFTGNMNIYLYNLMMIPINFTASNIHFWFIYTILGLYLLMPIISPWLKQASKKDLLWFLSIWAITLLFPYIRLWFPQIHGECTWNNHGMLIYFSGYLGYIFLGIFLNRYNTLSTQKSCLLGALLFVIGYIITYKGLWFDIGRLNSQKVSEVNDQGWITIETMIGYITINVAMMTTGIFIFFQKMKIPRVIQRFVSELSKLSFGIFLVHYILYLWIGAKLIPTWNLSPGIEEVLIAIIVFIASYIVAKVISFLPKSKYLIG